ncbi:peptide-methionine (S)-S-oxide reductase MsrA [Janibacter sp. DB-40]|uniref:peptide-methionine (S)-S-oxide reductase MsrA n=1 Tax=Janibacter sp. DB-40 TaxID=3028808 RepID=UPI0024074C6A|nr:peptide-methionine (S)-S-oxide reductase MsrA [Janibacter sp. DB-40]
MFGRQLPPMPTAETALPGRDERPFTVPTTHAVLGTPLEGPWPEGTQVLHVAMGCYWGVERIFWQLPGVVTTAAGYMGGFTPNPTYEEVCTGLTGHAESVLIAYDPAVIHPEQLLKAFWENHDPTTANRQGNDVGTQYRSAIFWDTPEQRAAAEATAEAFGRELAKRDLPPAATEIVSTRESGPFWYAEAVHQQYLHHNPGGYCNHGPNGLTCPVGVADLPAQTDIMPPS